MRPNLKLVPAVQEYNPRMVPLTESAFRMVAAMQPGAQQNWDIAWRMANVKDHAFAVLDGGDIICAWGAFPIHFGRAHGWLLRTPFARPRHMAFTTRKGRECFDWWQETDPVYRRIEIQIAADQPWRESFAKRLGMTEAFGPMQAWDAQGRDHWQYARIA
jgi:hypothetical protein